MLPIVAAGIIAHLFHLIGIIKNYVFFELCDFTLRNPNRNSKPVINQTKLERVANVFNNSGCLAQS